MAIPVVTINDRALHINEWWQLSGWLSYGDADGNAAVTYQFWDSGSDANSGYFWTSSNSHYPAATTIQVAAADIDDVWVRGGAMAGSDTLWVRAFDGTEWSNWDPFTLTTLPNTPPVVSISDHSVKINQWTQIQNWLSYADADGNAATKYQFWDGGVDANGGYFWTSDNDHHPANTTIEVAASDIDDVWVRGGATGGSETLWVRAFDGLNWGNWDSFTLTTVPNTAPVATINDHTVKLNEWTQIQNWLSYSDANGDAATKYQFWDSGADASSGYFWTLGNDHQPANTTIEVAASDIDDVWVRGGTVSGSETMWVRAFDGMDWGSWDSFTLTSQNALPVATINDHSLHTNEWAQVQSWLSSSDADGTAATKYQFWDGGSGASTGYFWTPDNPHQPAGTAIEVAASDLADVWVRGGTADGTETMYVRAFDGSDWGVWDSFTLTTLPNSLPVATINDHSLGVNEWAQLQDWLTYSDADNNPAQQYQFWDGGALATSGYFWTPDNTHQPAGTAITVLAADLADAWVRGGQTLGSETMYVRAFDGTDWGAWDAFNLTTHA